MIRYLAKLRLDLWAHKRHLALARAQAARAIELAKEAQDQAEANMADYIDAEARCRRLEEQLDFVCGYRLAVYDTEDGEVEG